MDWSGPAFGAKPSPYDVELAATRASLIALRAQGVARNEGFEDGLKGWVRV